MIYLRRWIYFRRRYLVEETVFVSFSSLNSFLMTADSQFLVDFEFWPCFPVQGAEGSTQRNH